MIAYADASALAKRYLAEQHRELVTGFEALVASTISAVEVSSAIWRKQRMGELTPADAAVLAAQAQWDLTGGDPRVIVLPPTNAVVQEAAWLTGTSGLRACDALQLASALATREAYPGCTAFACFDRSLSAAAAAHGFELITA